MIIGNLATKRKRTLLMLKFTKRQERSINTRGNVLVSAAAGSGKTRVLTERICKILSTEEVKISEILVLTFTDAAAAEMKNRIYHRLYDMSIEKSSEELGIVAESVVKADISTVHSFCQKVIRDNYFALGLSPTFKIGAEIEAKKLLYKSLAEILDEKMSAHDVDTLYLFDKFGMRTGESLKEIIIKIYDELMVLPEPETYRKKVIKQYDETEYKKRIKTILRRDISNKIDASLETLESLFEVVKKSDMPKTTDILNQYIEETKNHAAVFSEKSYEQYCRLSYMSATFNIDKMDDAIKQVIRDNRKFAQDMIKATKTSVHLLEFEKNFEAEKNEMKKDAQILLNLVFELMQRYQEKKAHANFLDFSDLEHFAYGILKKSSTQINYKYVFIDEYQDTNPIQEAILKLVAHSENMFMVGDVKQSVYGFRHADPKIFINKQNKYDEYFDEPVNHHDELIRMNENFRSAKKVVKGINHIMGRIMTPEFGGIDYANAEALIHGSSLNAGKVSLQIVDSDEKIKAADDAVSKSLGSKEAEAFAVANQIKNVLGQTIIERESGKEKRIEYRDIAVLLRELKNTGVVYKRIFERLNIPVECDIKAEKEIPEIKVYANFLKILDNPRDDIAMLSVLKFENFGFNSDELVRIKINMNEKYGSFYDCVMSYSLENEDALKRKLVDFFYELDDIRLKSKILPKKEFLEYVFKKASFEEILSTKQNSKIDLLKSYMSELNAQTPKTAGLSRIVDFIKDLENNGQHIEIKNSQKSQNAVKIITIHKSKGLEYPVVFLAGLDKDITIANRKSMNIDRELGIGLKLIDVKSSFAKQSMIMSAILLEKHDNEVLESIRLLYVAMTRAENRLYLIGEKKGLTSAFSKWLFYGDKRRIFAKSFLDFIVPELLNRQGFFDGFKISRFMPLSLSKYSDIAVEITAKKCLIEDFSYVRKDKFNAFIDTKPNKITLGYEYIYNERLHIPSKKSVSSLNKENDIVTIAWKYDEKILARNDTDIVTLDGEKRGTAHHIFMQHIDYHKTTQADILSQVKQFVEKNILTPREADCLDLESLKNVLNSKLFDRIRKSSRVYLERNFTLKVDSSEIGKSSGEVVLIQGTIDCMFLEDDGYVIIDYKSDRKISADKIKKYTKQLDYYDRAVRIITDKNVKARYLYFLLGQEYLV